MTHFDLWLHYVGLYDMVTIDFFKALTIVYKMTVLIFTSELFSYFSYGYPFWPLWPLHDLWGQTMITLIAINPLVILTKLHDHAT